MKKHHLLISMLVIASFALLSMTSFNLNQQDPWQVPDKYKNMENPYAKISDDESIGRILYSKHCKSCHGTKGKGDGKKSETIDTPIGDFTSDSFKSQTDGSLYYKTFEGRDDMPSFKKKIIDEKEQWMVINYIKNL